VKIKPKISLLKKAVLLVGTGAAIKLYALMPAMVAIKEEQYIV